MCNSWKTCTRQEISKQGSLLKKKKVELILDRGYTPIVTMQFQEL